LEIDNRVIRNVVVRKDKCWGASWSLKDEKDIRKDFLRIQKGTLNPATFIERLDRFYNDQTVWIDKSRKYLEPLKVGYKDDKVVAEGLIRLAEYVAGKSDKLFKVYLVGTGSGTVSNKDFQLETEEVRLDIIENGGFIQNRGSTNYFGLMFPKTIQTITAPSPIKETAIVDDMDSTKDQMLLRTVLPDGEEISHIVNEDVFSFNHIIYNGSV
jgi:hypothetical protein